MVFLESPAAAHVNGEALAGDGGSVLREPRGAQTR